MKFSDLARAIGNHKWIVVWSAVVVTLLALGVSSMQPKQYAGVSNVLIAEQGTDAATVFERVLPGSSSQPERALQTEVQLIQQRPIVEATIRALDLKATPRDLMGRITVVEIGQTNVVKIVVTDNDARTAAMTANTVAKEYMAKSQEARRKRIAAAAREVELRMQALGGQIATLRRDAAAAKGSHALEMELKTKVEAYSTLGDKLEQLRVGMQLETGAGTIVSSAVPDTNPVSPGPLQVGALALILGLAFGVVLAFILDHRPNAKSGT